MAPARMSEGLNFILDAEDCAHYEHVAVSLGFTLTGPAPRAYTSPANRNERRRRVRLWHKCNSGRLKRGTLLHQDGEPMSIADMIAWRTKATAAMLDAAFGDLYGKPTKTP